MTNLKTLSLSLIALVLAVRLLSLGAYPLMDTTEARYGEMARIMVETANWVTPMFDYEQPFWGKPPLFAWLSAAGFELFGVNEFAARLPHTLVGLGCLGLVFAFARKQGFKQGTDALAVLILASSSCFFLISGAVMTDTALLFSVTLAMMAFWCNWLKRDEPHASKLYSHLFFFALALGMLAKGPIAVVLVAISLGIWTLIEGQYRQIFSSLRWRSGILLFLIVCGPWYVLAEIRSPGFLEYFLVGEHFKRFVVSGWEGDLYGSAHDRPRGVIWLYWIKATLPWVPLFCYQLWQCFKTHKSPETMALKQDSDALQSAFSSYLWCWLLAPMLLFTFSGNILWSYVLPSLPPFALLLARMHKLNPLNVKVYTVALLMPVLLLAAIPLSHFGVLRSSEKAIVQAWQQAQQSHPAPIEYWGKRPFSARFYSAGQAQNTNTALLTLTDSAQPIYIAIEHGHLPETWQSIYPQCDLVTESGKRKLLYCQSEAL